MKTEFNQTEILEVIDCTPTWEVLLLPMLDLYAQHKANDNGRINHKKDEIIHQFKSMAKAADKWNRHCKSL